MQDPSRPAAGVYSGTPLVRHLQQVSGVPRARRLLVVGSSAASLRALREQLEHGDGRVTVVGIVSAEPPQESSDWNYLGQLDALESLLGQAEASEVATCLEAREWPLIERVVLACSKRAVPVWIPIVRTDGHGLLGTARARRPLRLKVKRSIDVVGAAFGLAVSAPLLAVIAIAILLTGGRPVLFRQLRAGKDGRPFRIFKFRTMHREADALRASLRASNELSGQAAFKMTHDPRVTRIGRWLRRTSLDEVPQLWNVLMGDMSLVGPRPHPYDDLAGYQPWHVRRLAVKPGLTGLWQVELRGDPDFDECVRKDLEYIERWSLALDLSLIVRTVPAVLRGTGR